MFDLPDAKRVRREDLSTRSTSSSPSPDLELEAAYHARLASIYGSAHVSSLDIEDGRFSGAGNGDIEPHGEEDDEGGFAFRLFGGEDARRIVIREEDLGQGAFVGRRDPRAFVVGKAEGERRAKIESVAMSGEEVLRRRRERAWGLEVPWRVMVVREGGRKGMKSRDGLGVKGGESGGDDEKRKRAGKKKRIAIRVKKRKEEGEREKREREEAVKEERDREKRIRRNKGKKVKRRMKEKAKKAGAGSGEGGTGTLEGSVIADPPLSVDDRQEG